MTQKKLLVVAVLIATVIAFLEYLSHLQIQSYESRARPSRMATLAVYRYLGLARHVPVLARDYALIANAFNVARLDSDKVLEQLGYGGYALRSLISVSQDDRPGNEKWRALAAYEALVILTAMPWDAVIATEAERAAVALKVELDRSSDATDAEKLLTQRILGIYAVRREQGISLQPLEFGAASEKGRWLAGMQHLRINWARCMNAGPMPGGAAAKAIDGGFGFNWLASEVYDGWDEMRVKSVRLSSKDPVCLRDASLFEKMMNHKTGKN